MVIYRGDCVLKEYLYHGSDYSGIKELEARSKLHNTDKKVV